MGSIASKVFNCTAIRLYFRAGNEKSALRKLEHISSAKIYTMYAPNACKVLIILPFRRFF